LSKNPRQPTQPISQLLVRLWPHISRRRRGQLGLLLVLMVLTSFTEIFSISAILPFLAVLTEPERLFEHTAVQPIIQAMGVTEPTQLLLPITISFCVATTIAGGMRVLMIWANTRLSYATGSDLSNNVYRRTLYQPYAVHCNSNSSELINSIATKILTVITIITSILVIGTSCVMLLAVLIVLLSLEPLNSLMVFGGFGLIYGVITILARKRLLMDSQRAAYESTLVIKALQEGLGGIRDVLIDGSQATYSRIYHKADMSLRRAQGNYVIISASPRYGIEVLSILVLAALAYSLAPQADGITKAIPILGALALGAQRLLPVFQQIYAAWSCIQSGQASLQDILVLLEQNLPDYADQSAAQSMPFRHSICLNQLGFRYNPQTHNVLKQLNLTIVKGSRVGFIGTTGSGKSTLLDIVMGLLQPTDGTLEIDGQTVTHGNQRTWQTHIAHVPQAVFLADLTIEENIAFGLPKDQIDHRRVRQSAQQAQIFDSIESMPKKFQTFVGEHGIRLSGGQRQRIGIARALYKQADVIIFDEATSSLDNKTEEAVMQSIEGLSKDITLLIIAHRLTTLKNCTQIVELGEGSIKRVGSYQDLMNYTQSHELVSGK
jgi:ATP-binding cassette, subfamily B, bacterial PglK